MDNRYGCTEQEFRSVKLYEGGRMYDETDDTATAKIQGKIQ